MTNTVIPSFIVKIFEKELTDIKLNLLKQISKDYELDLKELEDKYLPKLKIIPESEEKIKIIKTRNYNLNLPEEDRCMAKTKENKQCMRSKQDESKYCTIHQLYCPYGNINEKTKIKNKKWEKLY
jgi:hypothetical protein